MRSSRISKRKEEEGVQKEDEEGEEFILL